MESKNYSLNGNQLIAIATSIIGIFLVLFGSFLVVQWNWEHVDIGGGYSYDREIYPYLSIVFVMLLIAVALLVVSLILMVRSMKKQLPNKPET